jgi:dTDP-4-dehydrorhamnose 3,5-epimerase
MFFKETRLKGAFVIELERQEDERGFFARTWCRDEFEQQGLTAALTQCSVSRSRTKGTLRGLHYQVPPYEETKLVRCTRGAIYDVIVDLRPDSATYMQHFGVILSSANQRAIYVPEGCAHGVLTLADETDVFYQMSQSYEPAAARGIRWNDSRFGIVWPEPVRVIGERDRTYSDFAPASEEQLSL